MGAERRDRSENEHEARAHACQRRHQNGGVGGDDQSDRKEHERFDRRQVGTGDDEKRKQPCRHRHARHLEWPAWEKQKLWALLHLVVPPSPMQPNQGGSRQNRPVSLRMARFTNREDRTRSRAGQSRKRPELKGPYAWWKHASLSGVPPP